MESSQPGISSGDPSQGLRSSRRATRPLGVLAPDRAVAKSWRRDARPYSAWVATTPERGPGTFSFALSPAAFSRPSGILGPGPVRGPAPLSAARISTAAARSPGSRGKNLNSLAPSLARGAGGVEGAHVARIPRAHGRGRGSERVPRPGPRSRPWLSAPAPTRLRPRWRPAPAGRPALPCPALAAAPARHRLLL